jgi:hypothetical protein
VGLVIADHDDPLYRRIRPPAPTAMMFELLLPQMP